MSKFRNDEFDSKLKSYFMSKSDLENYISLNFVYSLEDYTDNHWMVSNESLVVISEEFGDSEYEYNTLVLLSDEYSIYVVDSFGDKYYIVLRNENEQTG